MFQLIWRTFKPPIFDDEDKTRIAGLLNVILLTILASSLLNFMASWVINAFQPSIDDIAFSVIPAVLVGSLLALMRRGRVQLAGRLLCYGLWVIITLATIAFGGVRAPIFTGYLIVITIAGLVLGGTAVLGFAGLAVLAGLGILYLDLNHLLPAPRHSSVDEWTLLTILLLIAGVLLYLAARSIEGALEHSRSQTNALRESEQRLALAVEGSNIGLWDWDVRSNEIYFSPQWKKQLGYNDTEIDNRFEEWERRLHPDDHDQVLTTIQTYIADSWPEFEAEYRLRHKDGSYRWILIRATLIKDERGKPYRMLGSHLDITERKQAEEALRQSEEHFSKIFHASPIPIMISSLKEGRFIDVNASFSELSGYSREEVIGHTALEFNTWVDNKDRAAYIEAVREHGRVHAAEAGFRTKSGEIRDTLFSGEVLNLGGELCLLTMLYDITERKRAEERFSKIFHASPISTVVTRLKDGHYMDVNESFLEQSGYQREEVIGRTARELDIWQHPEHRAHLAERLGAEGRVRHFETQFRTKSGDILTALVSLEMIELTGEPCVLTMTYDITERIRAEKALLEAEVLRIELAKEKELNQVRTGLVSMLSHEFRTPLAVVLSSSDLLQTYGDRITPERKSEHLHKIQVQVKRLTDMIDDVLIMSRVDAGHQKFEPILIDVGEFCRQISDDMQQTTTHHRIVFSDSSEIKAFNADEKLLRQAVTNLISNAIKYSPQGGRVEVALSATEERIIIRISDEGIGIPDMDQKRLFEMFHRASNVGHIQGTGLGLAIVKRAVEQHHGTISVESKPGVGTVFTLSMPYAREKSN